MGQRIGKRRRTGLRRAWAALWAFGGLLLIALACGGRSISAAGSGGGADDSTSTVASAVSGMGGAASAIGSSVGMLSTMTSTFSTATASTTTGTTGPLMTTAGVTTGFGAGGMTGSGSVATGGPIQGSCSYPIYLGSGTVSLSSYAPPGPNEFSGECGGSGYETYFVWQAPEAAVYAISTFGSEFDTVLYQFEEPNCSGTGVLQCNDDTGDEVSSQLIIEADAGQSITFMIDSYDGGGGRYQLQLEKVAGNSCPEPLFVLEGVGDPLIEGEVPFDDPSLNDPGRDDCNGGPPRLRFDWTAPQDGVYRFDTYGSNYDTVLTLRPECTASRVDPCNDDAGPTLGSELRAELSRGQRLRLEIAAYGGEIYVEGGGDPVYRLNVSQL